MTADRCRRCGRPFVWITRNGRKVLVYPGVRCPGQATARSTREGSLGRRAAIQRDVFQRSAAERRASGQRLPDRDAPATLAAPIQKRGRTAPTAAPRTRGVAPHGHIAR